MTLVLVLEPFGELSVDPLRLLLRGAPFGPFSSPAVFLLLALRIPKI